MIRPLVPVSFDPHRDAIEGETPDPWGYSRLDRLDGLGTPLPVRHAAPRRATHVRQPVQWDDVITSVALVLSIVGMICVVAVITLALVGA